MTNTGKQVISVAAMIFTTVIWGFTFILVKWTVAGMDVYFFLFLRFVSAFLLMFLIFSKKLCRVGRETVRSALILSLFLGVSFILQTEGLRFTTATNSSMITCLYLVLIPIFSFIFFKAKTRVSSVAGAVVSVVGLYFLTQYSYSGISLGDYLTLACAAGYAWHVILTGRFTVKHNLIPLVVFQFMFVSIFMGIISLFKGSFTTDISRVAWFTIGVTAIFATAFAVAVQTAAQRYVDATRVGIIFALEAVFGALFGWMLGGETLTEVAFVGACLMVLGMIVSEIQPVTKYLLKYSR